VEVMQDLIDSSAKYACPGLALQIEIGANEKEQHETVFLCATMTSELTHSFMSVFLAYSTS
jgi:hypothetical protein